MVSVPTGTVTIRWSAGVTESGVFGGQLAIAFRAMSTSPDAWSSANRREYARRNTSRNTMCSAQSVLGTVEEVAPVLNRWNVATGAGIGRRQRLSLLQVNRPEMQAWTFEVDEC